MSKTTKNQAEVNQFDRLGADWWDEDGPMKPLHRLNPVRIDYLKSQICAHFDRDTNADLPLKGIKILDVGCGGGLVCEPLARLGATVTGLDAAPNNIRIAAEHAEGQDLKITYKNVLAEDLARKRTKYDVVLALEIIEHVDNVSLFVESCASLTNKDGLLTFSTLNRNPKSYLLGIVAAEYVLRWLPRGTHDWNNFKKPSEIAALCAPHGFVPEDVTGLVYNPLSRSFSLSKSDLDVNYFVSFVRGA